MNIGFLNTVRERSQGVRSSLVETELFNTYVSKKCEHLEEAFKHYIIVCISAFTLKPAPISSFLNLQQ